MPAYCTSDAREFGNKQGTFLPPPLKRKREWKNKTQHGETEALCSWEHVARCQALVQVRQRDLLTETCGEQSSCGSGSVYDGTVCSHSWGDSFILGAIWLYWREAIIIKYLQTEGSLKSIEVEIYSDRWWVPIAHHELASMPRKEFCRVHAWSRPTLVSICFSCDWQSVTPMTVKPRGRELS